MSTSGLGAIITLIIHGLFILSGLTLLTYAIKKTGLTRNIFGALFVLVTVTYILWVTTKDNWKNEIEQSYVGKYELTKYKDCLLELKTDNSYSIYNKTENYESGTWKYFDDGDISFIEFDNGGQLGNNEYEYRQK
jgi:hypothetical protein